MTILDRCRSVPEPVLIQGGMGVGVSSWRLAKAVSQAGQLGVVSGVGLDITLARRLQLGDPGGHIRRALIGFPFPAVASRILSRYYIPGGKAPGTPFLPHPIPHDLMTREGLELCTVGHFVEVYLAKEGHDGIVGVNLMERLQLPTLPSLFGAMLARVDYVLMGAGIPRAIPGILDRLSEGMCAELAISTEGASPAECPVVRFDPAEVFGYDAPLLPRPRFLAIVSSAVLATALARKATGYVDGFIIEGACAGGHNAPPRGPLRHNQRGEPIYGPRDQVDLDAIRSLGRPFWLAGGYDSPQKIAQARVAGATGVQVGTAFAFCEESSLTTEIKRKAIAMCRQDTLDVVTDPLASPTGFPFKVLSLPGTLSDPEVYQSRKRYCSLGGLRHPYRKPDGSLGWRCPAEPEEAYVAKGGYLEDAIGRKCFCEALLANIGLGQCHGDYQELPLVTCGESVRNIAGFLPSPTAHSYSAQDVVRNLLRPVRLDGGDNADDSRPVCPARAVSRELTGQARQ